MIDLAYSLIEQHANNLSGKTLWVVDESYDGSRLSFFSNPDLIAISNRIDVSETIQSHGVECVLTDFDFSVLESGSFSTVIFRVAKEKAIVHHVINALPKLLVNGGELWLFGAKGEGIKTYTEKAAAYLGGHTDVVRGKKGFQLSKLFLGESIGVALDDQSYSQLRSVESIEDLYSKPGVFGWQKIDKGSQFLVEYLPTLFADNSDAVKHVIDLGCGYGFISIACHKLTSVDITATDNNVAAVLACQKNFDTEGISGEVVLTDCGKKIREKADIILCNPPFHAGFDHSKQLTEKFIQRASELLNNNGQALFVVNSFIGLEKVAEEYFSEYCVVNNNQQFKLLLLKK